VKVGPWPLFNLADSAITVGAVLVAVAVLRDRPGRGDAEGAEHGG
jgi:lipoprotein signal peptidase